MNSVSVNILPAGQIYCNIPQLIHQRVFRNGGTNFRPHLLRLYEENDESEIKKDIYILLNNDSYDMSANEQIDIPQHMCQIYDIHDGEMLNMELVSGIELNDIKSLVFSVDQNNWDLLVNGGAELIEANMLRLGINVVYVGQIIWYPLSLTTSIALKVSTIDFDNNSSNRINSTSKLSICREEDKSPTTSSFLGFVNSMFSGLDVAHLDENSGNLEHNVVLGKITPNTFVSVAPPPVDAPVPEQCGHPVEYSEVEINDIFTACVSYIAKQSVLVVATTDHFGLHSTQDLLLGDVEENSYETTANVDIFDSILSEMDPDPGPPVILPGADNKWSELVCLINPNTILNHIIGALSVSNDASGCALQWLKQILQENDKLNSFLTRFGFCKLHLDIPVGDSHLDRTNTFRMVSLRFSLQVPINSIRISPMLLRNWDTNFLAGVGGEFWGKLEIVPVPCCSAEMGINSNGNNLVGLVGEVGLFINCSVVESGKNRTEAEVKYHLLLALTDLIRRNAIKNICPLPVVPLMSPFLIKVLNADGEMDSFLCSISSSSSTDIETHAHDDVDTNNGIYWVYSSTVENMNAQDATDRKLFNRCDVMLPGGCDGLSFMASDFSCQIDGVPVDISRCLDIDNVEIRCLKRSMNDVGLSDVAVYGDGGCATDHLLPRNKCIADHETDKSMAVLTNLQCEPLRCSCGNPIVAYGMDNLDQWMSFYCSCYMKLYKAHYHAEYKANPSALEAKHVDAAMLWNSALYSQLLGTEEEIQKQDELGFYYQRRRTRVFNYYVPGLEYVMKTIVVLMERLMYPAYPICGGMYDLQDNHSADGVLVGEMNIASCAMIVGEASSGKTSFIGLLSVYYENMFRNAGCMGKGCFPVPKLDVKVIKCASLRQKGLSYIVRYIESQFQTDGCMDSELNTKPSGTSIRKPDCTGNVLRLIVFDDIELICGSDVQCQVPVEENATHESGTQLPDFSHDTPEVQKMKQNYWNQRFKSSVISHAIVSLMLRYCISPSVKNKNIASGIWRNMSNNRDRDTSDCFCSRNGGVIEGVNYKTYLYQCINQWCINGGNFSNVGSSCNNMFVLFTARNVDVVHPALLAPPCSRVCFTESLGAPFKAVVSNPIQVVSVNECSAKSDYCQTVDHKYSIHGRKLLFHESALYFRVLGHRDTVVGNNENSKLPVDFVDGPQSELETEEKSSELLTFGYATDGSITSYKSGSTAATLWFDHLLEKLSAKEIVEFAGRCVLDALLNNSSNDPSSTRSLNSNIPNRIRITPARVLKAFSVYSKERLERAEKLANNSHTTKHVVSFADVGGYATVKKELYDVFQRSIIYRRLFELSPIRMPRSVLLYGLPGCGKTYCAHAVVHEAQLECIYIRGPELLDKYIGASEKAVRKVFEDAKRITMNSKSCLIFFDEFEAMAPKRGRDNTGVTDRVVNQLLTFIDGAESTMSPTNHNCGNIRGKEKEKGSIYILAATSRPDMIDAALLRPGRIEKHIYIGLPGSADIEAVLRIRVKPLVDVFNAKQQLEGDAVRRVEDYAEVFCEIGVSAAERCFTVADVGAIINTAYIDTVYKKLNVLESIPNAVLFTPPELLQSYHNHSASSLSKKDIQFYNSIYSKFDPTVVDVCSVGAPDRVLQTTLG